MSREVFYSERINPYMTGGAELHTEISENSLFHDGRM